MLDPETNNHSNKCLILLKFLLQNEKANSLKKLLYHTRSVAPYKIDFYDSSPSSVLKCLSFNIQNAYIRHLKFNEITFSSYLADIGGYLFVECRVYHNIDVQMSRKVMYFKLRLIPKNKRHKSYTLILSDMDMIALIACDPKKFYDSKHMLV